LLKDFIKGPLLLCGHPMKDLCVFLLKKYKMIKM